MSGFLFGLGIGLLWASVLGFWLHHLCARLLRANEALSRALERMQEANVGLVSVNDVLMERCGLERTKIQVPLTCWASTDHPGMFEVWAVQGPPVALVDEAGLAEYGLAVP
jgi:hypothetical protein